MNASQAVRMMLKVSGNKASEVSFALGLARNNISNTINAGVDIGASKLAAIAEECGWRLMLINDNGDECIIDPKGGAKCQQLSKDSQQAPK